MKATMISILLLTISQVVLGAAADVPSSFTYQGKIFKANGIEALEAPSVTFKVQIRSADGLCLLFEETHHRDMTGTSGIFSILVGQGTNTNASALTLTRVFDNSSAMTGAASCVYTPASGDSRRIRFSYDDGNEVVTLSTDQSLGSVPYALNSMTLQGATRDQFVQISAQTTQAKVDAMMAQSTNILALANGTSNAFVKSSDLSISAGIMNLSSGGVRVADAPASNDYAINRNYADSRLAGQSIDVSSLANGQTVVWNSTSNKWTTSSLANALTSGMIGGSTSFVTSGSISTTSNVNAANITATNMSASNLNTHSVQIFDASNAHHMTMTVAGTLAADMNLILPTSNGSIGQMLTTDGTGNLSWTTATAKGTASGDLSGSYPAPTVSKVQGIPVSSVSPAAGQVYRYNGTTLMASFVGVSDLKTSAGLAQIPTNCTSIQTMVYSSLSDSWICQDITFPTGGTISGGILTTDSRLSDARIPTGTAGGDLTGSFPNPLLTATGVGAGSYAKVTVDAKGRVTTGGTLTASDIPAISFSKITSGLPTTLSGYGITDAVSSSDARLTDSRSPSGSAGGDLVGTFPNPTLGTTGVVAGSYSMVTVDTKGRVTSGSMLVAANVPSLPWSKITSGLPTTLSGYGITDAVGASDSRLSDSRTPTGAAGGDLSGTYPNPSVSKVNGIAFGSTMASSGQVYRYNGTMMVATYMNFADLKTSGGVSQFPTSCASNQTLSYSSITDVWTCQTITMAAADIPNHSWSKITSGLPTTLAGYGITDAIGSSDARLTDSRAPHGSAGGDLTGTYPNPALTATGVATGSYVKVTVDTKGRVTAGTTLVASDIPALAWSKITSGLPTTLAGYGITDFFSASNLDAGTGVTLTTSSGTTTIAVSTGTMANQIVQLDSSAKLPAVDASQVTGVVGAFSNMKVYDTNGTFSVPANVTRIYVQAWGAGGGGGGGTVSLGFGGAGGGAGAYGAGYFTVTAGSSIVATIGAAGTRGGSSATGGTGGNTTFGALITANGGSGGPASTSTVGAGGTSTATLNVAGGRGRVGQSSTGGMGGSAGGGGGQGGDGSASTGSNGYDGVTPGGAGGGGMGVGLNTSSGGLGGGGRVIVWY